MNIFGIPLDSETIIWIIYLYIGFLLCFGIHNINKTLEKQDRLTILAYPPMLLGWCPFMILSIIMFIYQNFLDKD